MICVDEWYFRSSSKLQTNGDHMEQGEKRAEERQPHTCHSFKMQIENEKGVQFTHSVVSNSLQPHEPQHARPPCPSPTPGVYPSSCPLSWWCHPAISSSAVPFSSCPQSFPASESSNESALRMRWPKYWSFSFSIIPSKEIPGLISFRMDWLDLLAVQGDFSNTTVQKHQFFSAQPSSQSNSHMTTRKTIVLTRRTL